MTQCPGNFKAVPRQITLPLFSRSQQGSYFPCNTRLFCNNCFHNNFCFNDYRLTPLDLVGALGLFCACCCPFFGSCCPDLSGSLIFLVASFVFPSVLTAVWVLCPSAGFTRSLYWLGNSKPVLPV